MHDIFQMPSSLGGASQTMSNNRQISKNSRLRDHLSQVNYANKPNDIASKSVSGYTGGANFNGPKSPMMYSSSSKAHLNMVRSHGQYYDQSAQSEGFVNR